MGAQLEEENRIQMKYASEYGKQAEAYQKKDYERRVDKVEARFKHAVAVANRTSPGVLAMLSAPGSLSPAVVVFAFGLAFLLTAFITKRRKLGRAALRRPLLLVE